MQPLPLRVFRRPSLPFIITSICVLGITVCECPAQVVQAETIATRGQPAPGFPKNEFEFALIVFEDFGVPSGFVNPEPVPAIDRQGNVTFAGILGDGIPGPPVTPAVLRFNGDKLLLVAKPGDPAPGMQSTFSGFNGPPFFPLETTPFIYNGKLVVSASIDNGNIGGIWSDRFGDLELIVKVGDELPAAPSASIHSMAVGFEGTDILINAAIFNAATDGLWRNRNGEFELIAIDGVPAPGVEPGVFFGEGTSLAFFGAVDGWDLNNAGNVVFNGYLMGTPAECGNGICETQAGENCLSCPEDCNGQQSGNPALRFCCGNGGGQNPVGCDDPRCTINNFECNPNPALIHENNDEAIWADSPGSGLQLIVREGDPAPQAGPNHWFGSGGNGELGGLETFGPDSSITSRINDDGALLLGARVTSPEFYVKVSLWTNRNGPLELIGLAASGLGDPNYPGDPAPGLEQHGATFADFLQGDINNDGVIAFRAAAVLPGQQLNSTVGIWWDMPGKMSLIAALGEPVPGIDGAVFEEIMFPFPHASSDWDWMLFTASYTGAPAGTFPIFLATADGNVRLVLQPGTPIQLDTGEIKFVADYQLGEGHTDDGRYVFELTFNDGEHGVYVLDLVPTSSTPGDIAPPGGDGLVNVDDLLAVINGWGPCANPNNCPADIAPAPSGNDVVDVDDLLMVIDNWT